MWVCQVCGHDEGWPDGRLSGDVLCEGCAAYYIMPRLLMAVERSKAGVMIEVLGVVDEIEALDNGWHGTDLERGVH